MLASPYVELLPVDLGTSSPASKNCTRVASKSTFETAKPQLLFTATWLCTRQQHCPCLNSDPHCHLCPWGLTCSLALHATLHHPERALQGREKDVVIFSAVRTRRKGGIGFVADERRINVGLTRARSSLLILGNAGALQKDAVWASLIRHARETGCAQLAGHTWGAAADPGQLWEKAALWYPLVCHAWETG